MNTHDCVVPGVRVLLRASVWQGQREAAVRSLQASPKVPLTCVTSACQRHQGASVLLLWHLFTCGTIPRWLAHRYPHPLLPSLFLKASVTHLSFLSSIPGFHLLATAPTKAEKEPSERKWWPLCPSSRLCCFKEWHITEVVTDSHFTLQHISPWKHWSLEYWQVKDLTFLKIYIYIYILEWLHVVGENDEVKNKQFTFQNWTELALTLLKLNRHMLVHWLSLCFYYSQNKKNNNFKK